MVAVTLVGMAAAIYVIVSYFRSVKHNDPGIFSTANIYGGIILVPANIMVGAWFGALIAGFFLCVAVYDKLRPKEVT